MPKFTSQRPSTTKRLCQTDVEHKKGDGDDEFQQKISFNDEAHFHLNGFVNKQNCQNWGSESPRVVYTHSAHPHKVTVWCAIRARGMIGPYFFKDAGPQDECFSLSCDTREFFCQNWKISTWKNIYSSSGRVSFHAALETIRLLLTKFKKSKFFS